MIDPNDLDEFEQNSVNPEHTFDGDDEDFVENCVKEHEGRPLHAAAYCAKCGQIKPLSEFRRFMTTAEAKYRGYSGNRKVQIETTHCADCRPRRRRNLQAFTTAELKKKARKGEVSETMVAMIEKQRRAEAAAAMRGAVVKRWDAARAKQWATLLDDLHAEILSVRQQLKYANTRGNRLEMVAYLTGYMEILTKVRADLKIQHRKATAKPEHERWQEYVTHYERNIVAALWHDVPFKLKSAGARKPQLFAIDRTSEVHVPPPPSAGYVPKPKEKTPPGWPTPPEATANTGPNSNLSPDLDIDDWLAM